MGENEQLWEPRTWGGHDPLAWFAAGVGVMLAGGLTAVVTTVWGIQAGLLLLAWFVALVAMVRLVGRAA